MGVLLIGPPRDTVDQRGLRGVGQLNCVLNKGVARGNIPDSGLGNLGDAHNILDIQITLIAITSIDVACDISDSPSGIIEQCLLQREIVVGLE